jgi:Spy/CpxP family protein refolding chaperone
MNQDSQRKARLWLALVFLVGAAIGIVFGYSFGHHTVLAKTPGPPISESERRARKVQEMTKDLDLTPEQSAKADDIIRRTHEEMKTIRDKAESDVDVVREHARDQMRQFLTPEQKPKFEEMVQRMDAERKKQQQQQQAVGK